MAVRQITTSQTLEDFRTQFNALAANDFGDIATLDNSLSATTVIGAVNELSAAVSAGLAVNIEDAASTVQQVAAGQSIRFLGTSNQTNVVVSSPDTVTVSLPASINITNNVTAGGVIQGATASFSGTSHTFGGLTLATGSITDSSGNIAFGNENLSTTGNITGTNIQANGTGFFTSNVTMQANLTVSSTATFGAASEGVANSVSIKSQGIFFEGATSNDFETQLTVTDPTADRVITLPDVTGTVITTGDSGTIQGSMIGNNTIENGNIANATIRAAKLNLGSDTLVVDTLNANTITGAASVASLVNVTQNTSANETVYITFVDGNSGNQGIEADNDLTYNPSTNVMNVRATSANYADLAEKYTADAEYKPGTVVMFGGNQEVTIADVKTKAVAGVVSALPAYLMNSKLEGVTVDVALQGRVMCKVKGDVNKGDMMVSAGDGFAMAEKDPQLGQVIGKALEQFKGDEGTVEVVVGRL